MIDQETLQHSIACARFAPFKLRLALDLQAVELPLRLVEDAWQRFASSPIAAIASSLEKEVIANTLSLKYLPLIFVLLRFSPINS